MALPIFLKEATNKKMVVINLMGKLGKSVKNKEIKEGILKNAVE